MINAKAALSPTPTATSWATLLTRMLLVHCVNLRAQLFQIVAGIAISVSNPRASHFQQVDEFLSLLWPAVFEGATFSLPSPITVCSRNSKMDLRLVFTWISAFSLGLSLGKFARRWLSTKQGRGNKDALHGVVSESSRLIAGAL